MGTWDDYRPERRANWEEVAAIVRSSVSMEDVLSLYFPSLPRRHHRCPCPLHNGKDLNFSYTRTGYKCFVCGASGDVVAFVKEACELSTRAEALQRICSDFNIGIDFGTPITRETSEKVNGIRAEAQKRQEEIAAWNEQYNGTLDNWCALDRRSRETTDPEEQATIRERMLFFAYQLDSMPQEPR